MQSMKLREILWRRVVFYPYYKLIDEEGEDVSIPYHDVDPRLPSGDCALLYGSLNVTEGWLRSVGYTTVADKAAAVRADMNFGYCYGEVVDPNTGKTNAYIYHQIDADTGNLSQAAWSIYSDDLFSFTWNMEL